MSVKVLKAYEGPCLRRYEEIHDKTLRGFQNDKNKLLHSKANRRLLEKTQVQSGPENINIRSRKSHTDEVMANSVIISEGLGLNTPLCEAIALGHDIGHVPYGHVGESTLSELCGEKFRHEVFGVCVAQHIERRGQGLNLSLPVLEGILAHSGGSGKIKTDKNQPK